MSIYHIITIYIVITAVLAYVNAKFLKLNSSIGLMILSVFFSLIITGGNYFLPIYFDPIVVFIQHINLSGIVLDIFLSFLLFAGAMHTDFSLLKKQKVSIILFSFISVLITCVCIGLGLHFIVGFFGYYVSMAHCLLFGALISPTDPIAVLSILTKGNIPKRIEINIVGESLFNDGIGVVLFMTMLSLIQHNGDAFSFYNFIILFIKEAFGGILFGVILGYALYYLIKSIDDYEAEILLTIAGVFGGTWLASEWHISAPLTMVVAGLITGHKTIYQAMNDETQIYVEKFWHLIDVILNSILFVLIGLKCASIAFQLDWLWMIVILIPFMLLVRYSSLYIPNLIAGKWIYFSKKDLVVMTWGGLRGGLSIAMALSIDSDFQLKNLFVALTFGLVVFSIVVQGLSMPGLIRKFYPECKEIIKD